VKVAVFVLLLAALPLTPAAACTGDCNDDNFVAPAEISLGVEIALARAELAACPAAAGGESLVTIEKLVAATASHLSTCVASTPTPTVPAAMTPTATPTRVEPIFPADYRATFVEVRNCRLSVEHGGINIRVLTNPIAAQPYLENRNPLPDGSIVVKEEFNVSDGSDCSDDKLMRWRAMRKEPGIDPQDGDWHWQWVDREQDGSRSVLFDDKSTCIGCHVRPACKSRDYMCTEEGDAGTLNAVLQNRPGALLSVSGTAADDVITVGADKNATGPAILHYDGTSWQQLTPHASGDLWWVSVDKIDGNFYASGEGGLVLRIDPASNDVTRMETPTTALLYGIWGTAANNLWSVGGTAAGAGVVLHYEGDAWTPVDVSGVIAGGVPTLFKVWGRSAREIYAVGDRGTILRYNGASWSQVSVATPFTRPLFTVHGDATRVFTVGGFIDGSILELEDGVFHDRTPDGLPQMNGVYVPGFGQPSAVGLGLSMARRSSTGWTLKQGDESSTLDFHSTWLDPEGGVWAVGGDLVEDELDQGVLYYAGTRTISSVIEQPPRCPTGETGPGGTVSYASDIAPLFNQAGCLTLGCHGGAFPSSGFDLRTYESSFKQGTEAQFVLDVCPIVAGDPDASYLVEKLLPSPRVGVRMPQNLTPLTAEQIELVRTWVLEGARKN